MGRRKSDVLPSLNHDGSHTVSPPSVPPRSSPATGGSSAETRALKRKFKTLVTSQRYAMALRVHAQAAKQHPDLDLTPTAAELWCLEGQLAIREGQGKRAEKALQQAIALGLSGEPHYWLARLRLQQGQADQALQLLEEAFTDGTLPEAYAGAYLKALLIQGEVEQVRQLISKQRQRFQPQQLHWASGVLHLLAGDPVQAQRQFRQMAGPATPGDHNAVWRAWSALESGDGAAAAAALRDEEHPAAVALILASAARTQQRPADWIDLERHDLPRRELALALELVHQLQHQNLLAAAQLLLQHERQLLNAVRDLMPLRRSLLLLAGQQALDRGAEEDAKDFWSTIVWQPAFDADLALRLYPLLDQGDPEDVQPAERIASQLLSWVRRAAHDNPTAWPQELINTTLARLHCWHADQQMRMGLNTQARQNVQQAQRLAPEHPDTIGRQGMLACLTGSMEQGIPLLWQALEKGCRSSHVFELLDEALERSGEVAEQLRLAREYGAAFGVMASEDADAEALPLWLDAVSCDSALDMASLLSSAGPAVGSAGMALSIFIDHVKRPPLPEDGSAVRMNLSKVDLEDQQAALAWERLLQTLPPAEQVEGHTAILVVIHRFAQRTSKAMKALIAGHLAALEKLAEDPNTPHGQQALQRLLLVAGLRIRRQEALREEASRLLRRLHQPGRMLPRALLDLRVLTTTKPWQAILEDQQRRDPENPLLMLAMASMHRPYSQPHRRDLDRALDLARRQQDSEAIHLCRREQAWAEESYDRAAAQRRADGMMRHPMWEQFVEDFDLRAFIREQAKQQGCDTIPDALIEMMLPEAQRSMAKAFAAESSDVFMLSQLAGAMKDLDDDDEAPFPRRSKRTFKGI